MRFPKLKVVLKVTLATLMAILIYASFLLIRQDQIIESGATGAGLGFGWVFLGYTCMVSGAAVVLFSLILLLLKWR